MAFNSNITPGRPPLLWSDVHDAFTKVNENFDILVATIGGGSGLTPLDFNTLDSNVSPSNSNTYSLGADASKWKSVFVSGWNSGPDALNGIWLGSSQIRGFQDQSGIWMVDLPTQSTVDGNLIIDPAKTFFKAIDVDAGNVIEAIGFGDTVNFISGAGITMTVNSSSDSITFDSTGILSIATGAGISQSTVSGVSTITNTGVRSLQSTNGLPSGRTAGAGISISGSTGDNIKVTNTGVISVSSGVGITVSTDTVTGDVTITNSAPAGNTFSQVEVNGDVLNRLVADAANDVLNIASGQGITLTKSVATDTLTITVNPVFDLKGSVFGDDSSLLVDAVDNKIYAGNGFYGNLVGNADTATLAATATTVALVATNATSAAHYITFVDTATGNENVRTDSDLTYNPGTNTLTAGTFATGSFKITGSTISTTDSSGITIVEQTTFNTDVIAENDISVLQTLFVQGSKVINTRELQAIVAASVDFADFKAKIAALV